MKGIPKRILKIFPDAVKVTIASKNHIKMEVISKIMTAMRSTGSTNDPLCYGYTVTEEKGQITLEFYLSQKGGDDLPF
jgi:hypothetical protein